MIEPVQFAEIAAKSALCSGAALATLRLLPHRSAAERSWIAHLGLVATLVVPFAGLLAPSLYMQEAEVVRIAPIAHGSSAPAVSTGALPAESTISPVTSDLLVTLLWAIPAVLLLLVTAFAVFRLFALRARAVVLVEQPWLSALAHAQLRMGFKNGAALLVSEELRSPVSWGLVRPTIVISEDALDGEGDAEAIIAHELAHVARLDWAKLLLARAATALFWFNPLVWLLARTAHQLREEAADDAVLLNDVDRTDYAALLVGAARHESRGLLLAANGVAPGRSSLGRRITRVLDRSLARAPARAAWSLACVAVGLALGTPLAALTTRTPPAQYIVMPTPPAPPRAPLPPKAVAAAIPPAGPAAPQPVAAPFAPLPPDAPATDRAAEAAADRAEALAGRSAALAERSAALAVRAVPAAPPPPPTPRMVRLSALEAVGIDAEELAAIRALGPSYSRLTSSQLVGMAAQGIDAGWLRDMKALGYADLPAGTYAGMAVQDAGPDFVREMARVGYTKLSPEQLIAMRVHGVNCDFVREILRKTGRRPSPDALLRLRITGIDPSAWPPGSARDRD